jgi:hypothetical protein
MTPIESIYEIELAVLALRIIYCPRMMWCPEEHRLDMRNGLTDFSEMMKILQPHKSDMLAYMTLVIFSGLIESAEAHYSLDL